MVTNPNIIKAKFDSGKLLVTEHNRGSPLWPDIHLKPLITYLYLLSARDIDDWDEGWRAVRASFTGDEIIVEMDSFESRQTTLFPLYLIQNTVISYPGTYTKQFIEKLKEPLLHELASSKQLTDQSGSRWVVTLWTKASVSIPGSKDHGL